MKRIEVRLASQSYPILVGTNLDRQLNGLLKTHLAGGRRLFVFFDAAVYALFGKNLERTLAQNKVNYTCFVIPGGEASKAHTSLNKIYDFLLEEKISRADFILAVGGGVVTDLAGYAAATVLRGVRWAVVSTTLLGMVDAALGGKTGINHHRGKNLIGAFWQPSFVICDLHYLQTLPKREFVAGLGEVLKYSGLAGSKMDSRLQDYLDSANLLNLKKLRPLVERCIEYKARIVMADERESRQRMFLNFGHTFAHAIEKSLGFGKLRHGEAVIIGLLAAVLLSKRVRPRSFKALNEYVNLVKTFLGFVRYYPLKVELVLNNLKLDKKRAGLTQKFVLLAGPGKPFIASGVKEAIVRNSLQECLLIYQKVSGNNG